MSVRRATAADEPALRALDAANWSSMSSPAPPPPPERPFFGDRLDPADVFVAELDGAVAGYVSLGIVFPVPSNAHVLQVSALVVDLEARGSGLGRALVQVAVGEARERGARRLTLRVLGPNTAARRLYARCGFEIEGVLREEFLLDGRYVDDVLMALALSPSAAPR